MIKKVISIKNVGKFADYSCYGDVELRKLNIIFADNDGRILNIAVNAPPCAAPRRCPTYRSIAPARYVLEIPGGRTQVLGVRPGDHLRFIY